MQNKVYFEERVKVVPLDMNALHDETENSLGDLVRLISGGSDDVLFENVFNPAVDDTVNIKILVPEQWFTIDGIPGKIPAQTVTLGPSPVPDRFKVFFVIRRSDTIDNRDRIQLAPPAVVTEPVIVRKYTTPRIEVTASGNPLVPPGPPALAPTDLGYLEYAEIVWDGVTLTSNHNTPAIYTFPGYAAGVGPHAGSHLSTGGDPIQAAAMGGPMGSIEGLVPAGAFVVLKGALQSVGINAASPYLTAVITGDNTLGNPALAKQVELRLRHNASLAVVQESGVDYLGLNFTTGPYAGSSNRPARSNHRHGPDETFIALDAVKVQAGIANLGNLVTVPTFTGVARILMTQIYWAPPGMTGLFPMFDCGWYKGSLGTIGVKAHIASDNVVKLEMGGYSFIELTTEALLAALAAVGGTASWTHVGSEAFPTSGDLYLKIIGSR